MKRCIALALIFVLLFSVKVNALNVSAKAAVVLCGDTGEVIFAKNENQKLSMASTTKIVTCIVAIENVDIVILLACCHHAGKQAKH